MAPPGAADPAAIAPEAERPAPSAGASSVGGAEPGEAAPPGSPVAVATVIAATVWKLPDMTSRKLGYVRLGQRVSRDAAPTAGRGCKGEWYRVAPAGYVCTDEAAVDPAHPVARAARVGPDLARPMPYGYGFVRATAPQYLKVPTRAEQEQSEFQLPEHLAWYAANRRDVQRVELGANDVPLGPGGLPAPGAFLPEGARFSPQRSLLEHFGGVDGAGVPWWLDGGRQIPNVSAFVVPPSAIFADRVRRKTGLSFVDAFVARHGDQERAFGVTVDLRLIPLSKVKPDPGSMFHGVEPGPKLPLPFALVAQRAATTWKLIRGQDLAKPAEAIPHRAVVPLSGKVRVKSGARYYQSLADPTRWLRGSDIGVVAEPPTWPAAAAEGTRWIDVSLVQQTLVLYEGRTPRYATLVSSGQDRLGDPKTSKATPQGEFRIRSKHVAAAMDSEENSQVLGGAREHEVAPRLGADVAATVARLRKAEKEGKRLDEGDRRRLENLKKGRHPEYGITMRRGSQNYELRDVPWIQYFASGYALHGAYWHDVFGTPRSHGCINLSPIDARAVFRFTEPGVPPGWHGVNAGPETGEGTVLVVRE